MCCIGVGYKNYNIKNTEGSEGLGFGWGLFDFIGVNNFTNDFLLQRMIFNNG